MTRVIAAIAYIVNKIRLALSLHTYYHHRVRFMASSHNPSVVDEHNVHINVCVQNKICRSHPTKRVDFSSNVVRPGRQNGYTGYIAL